MLSYLSGPVSASFVHFLTLKASHVRKNKRQPFIFTDMAGLQSGLVEPFNGSGDKTIIFSFLVESTLKKTISTKELRPDASQVS
jgi:hypothetical protein